MEILVLSHMYPSTYNGVGGIFVHEQVKELVKQGCKVKVVSPVPWSPLPINKLSAKWRAYSDIPAQATVDGIEVYYPHYISFPRSYLSEYSGYLMYTGIKGIIENIHRDFSFDIIHAHVALPDGYAAVMLRNKYHMHVVVTVHGKDLFITLNRNMRCLKALKKVFDEADSVITVSTKLKKIMERNIGNYDYVSVISNGINPRKLSPDNNRGILDRKTILSVSNLIAKKGIDLNLMALSYLVKKHPDLRYQVIGSGPEMNNLKRLMSKLNLDNHVEFLGMLPNETVMEYMASADIFSLPSWDEGFGVVYIEAMAHGKPIIACQGEGIEDVVKHGDTGMLVKTRDVKSLMSSLDYLLSHPEESLAIGKRGKELVLAEFTWKKNAENTIRLYNSLLTASR